MPRPIVVTFRASLSLAQRIRHAAALDDRRRSAFLARLIDVALTERAERTDA